MKNYLDGFVFPLRIEHLEEYRAVAQKVAEIWKEYGALTYQEWIADDQSLQGVISFTKALNLSEEEVAVFGWVEFPSEEVRRNANESVPRDPRIQELVTRLIQPERMIFDASRMVYGGFKPLV